MRSTQTAFLFVLGLASFAEAQTITPGPLACLPNGDNGAVTARVEPTPSDDMSVRLYFRRLSLEVEDFYYVEMKASGGGNFWTVFPQPEDTTLEEKKLKSAQSDETAWAEWWRTKEGSANRDPNPDLDAGVIKERASLGKLEKRDWMSAQDDKALQGFLKNLTAEPAEYFFAVYDPSGQQVARSSQQVVEVRDDCQAALTPEQAEMAKDLTVGETAPWQAEERVFHWECTGIDERIDPQNAKRDDNSCMVVAWWPQAAATALAALAIVVDDDPGVPPGDPPVQIDPRGVPPDEVSPSRP
jgi:hypothetical protein